MMSGEPCEECKQLQARIERLRKNWELAAKAMESLAMATPDRVLRQVTQRAAKNFRRAMETT